LASDRRRTVGVARRAQRRKFTEWPGQRR